MVGGSALVLGVWWLASREERVSTYAVRGALNAVTLDLGDADAVIVGGGEGRAAVDVRRTDRFAFGRSAAARREVAGGVLRLRSRCPQAVLGSCSASYRLTVPDNVPVTVRTGAGDVRFNRYRGSARIDTEAGDIAVAAFCGFALQARAETGHVSASAACPPERLMLRSAIGRRARGGAARALSRRRGHRRRPLRRARHHPGRRIALPDPGAQQQR